MCNIPKNKLVPFAETFLSFPSLKLAPGILVGQTTFQDQISFDPDVFDSWAETKAMPEERSAAQFLLSIWEPRWIWRCGVFDFFRSVQRWSERDRYACAKWVQHPFWVMGELT